MIRTYEPSEIDEITRILAPAFQDKVTAVIQDDEKALRIIPTIIRSITGTILVAIDGTIEPEETRHGDENIGSIDAQSEMKRSSGKMVGAIIVSVSEFKITLPIILTCLRVLGIKGSWHAFGMVNDYLRSEPAKLPKEGRLEAVGVLDSVRGQGIGKDLTIKGEEFLRSQGMDHYGLGVKTDNPAYHLYQKLGFKEIVRYNNSLDDWIYMRKELK